MTPLSLLLRLRPEQLPHFDSVSGVSSTLTSEELQWWQQFLNQVNDWLATGDAVQLRATQAALMLSQPQPEEHILSTTHLDDNELAAALAAGPTPFRTGPAALPPSALPHEQHEDIGATTTVSNEEIAAIIGNLPAATNLPMAIGDYAQLVAKTEPGAPYATAAGRLECHKHHNITDESHRSAIDQTFHRLFQTDHAVWGQFTQSLTEWRQWLKGPAHHADH